MGRQLKEKEAHVGNLEARVIMLRKRLDLEKSIVALENLFENQRYPMIIYGLDFHKGESNSHAGKNNNVEPKSLRENNSNNKTNNQGNK